MAHIRVGDELFNVMVSGPREAPVLLMSNSLGTDLRMWEPQLPELSKHFKVIRYDSRGHGDSVAEPGTYSIERLGKDAVAILDKLGVDKAHFVGLSMGGMVGQWLLSHAPLRINRAVLANTSAHQGISDIWNARAATAREEGMAKLSGPTLERWFTPEFRRKNPKIMTEIKAMVEATPPQGYAGCCLAIRDMDQRQSIKSIRKQVLVIIGKHDSATIPEHGRLIAETIPGARLLALDAAHLSNVEAAEAFTTAVVNFLQGRMVGEPLKPTEAAAAPKPVPAKTTAPVQAAAPKPPVAIAPKAAPTPAIAPKPTPKPVAASPAPAAAAKTPTVSAPAAKKPAPKKAAAKKAPVKAKPPAKPVKAKPAAKKTPAKKSAAKKAAKAPAKKAAARKAPAKKSAPKKAVAKKPVVKKPSKKPIVKKAVKKSAAKKAKKRR